MSTGALVERCDAELRVEALPFGGVASGILVVRVSVIPVVCGQCISPQGLWANKMELYTPPSKFLDEGTRATYTHGG